MNTTFGEVAELFRSPEIGEATSDGVRTAIVEAGGIVPTRLDTYVVLARRT